MLIEARELSRVYRRGQERVEALHSIHLDIARGTFGVIIGPSGGGKSTLLHLLGGIDRPTSGKLSVNGVSLESASEGELTRFRRENIGFVFQFYNLLPSINAVENVALPLLAKGWRRREALARAGSLLAQMDLSHRQRHKPAELSGGEQQRVALARAIAGDPCLVLADEPTGDLDTASAEGVMQFMLHLNQQSGVTFMVATHNEHVASFGNRLFELRNGQISEK